MLKINSNLERIGDIADGIARYVIEADAPFHGDLLKVTRLDEMYTLAIEMLEDVRKCFNEEDTRLARGVFKKDDVLDDINGSANRVMEALIRKEAEHMAPALHIISTIRKLERTGDQVKNIAEKIIFYLEAKVLKHRIIALTLILLLPGAPLPGQSPTETPPRQSSRFLFILNVSSGMSRRAEQTQGVAGNLIASGFKGEIKNGDTIGVLTYNDTLHTGQFPLKLWSAQSRQIIAAELVDFIKEQKFEKRVSHVEVVEGLSALTKKSDRLTVLIITDGAEAISGTPFDKEINLALKANESDLRKSKMPFVIVLRSEKGKIFGQSVNVPPWAIEFPKFTPEPEPVVVILIKKKLC